MKKKHILVADDDRNIVESLKNMLVPYCRVDTARTGFDALKMLAKEPYDAAIIDIDFGPGINGVEIATKLRSWNKQTKIIIFSAVNESSYIQSKLNDLDVVFCEKPLRFSVIRDIIEV